MNSSVTTPENASRQLPSARRPRHQDEPTLVDLLDRVIDRGVVISGDVVLSVAGVDLVHLGLKIVIRGIDTEP